MTSYRSQQGRLPLEFEQSATNSFVPPKERHLDLYQIYTILSTGNVGLIYPDNGTKIFTQMFKDNRIEVTRGKDFLDWYLSELDAALPESKPHILIQTSPKLERRRPPPEQRITFDGHNQIIFIEYTEPREDFGHYGCFIYAHVSNTMYYFDSMLRKDTVQRGTYSDTFYRIVNKRLDRANPRCDRRIDFYNDPNGHSTFEITGGALGTSNLYLDQMHDDILDMTPTQLMNFSDQILSREENRRTLLSDIINNYTNSPPPFSQVASEIEHFHDGGWQLEHRAINIRNVKRTQEFEAWLERKHTMGIVNGADNQNQYCYMWALLYLTHKISTIIKLEQNHTPPAEYTEELSTSFINFQKSIVDTNTISVALIKTFILYILRLHQINSVPAYHNLLSNRLFERFKYISSNSSLANGLYDPHNMTYHLYALADWDAIKHTRLFPDIITMFTAFSTRISAADRYPLLLPDPLPPVENKCLENVCVYLMIMIANMTDWDTNNILEYDQNELGVASEDLGDDLLSVETYKHLCIVKNTDEDIKKYIEDWINTRWPKHRQRQQPRKRSRADQH